jgi:isochorismate synthase
MAAVDAVVAALAEGRAEKVVLARELIARGDGPLHAGAVTLELKRRQPSCFVYLVAGADGSALVGASPELLVRRRGGRATSQAMAGTAARGRDAQEDGELARALQGSEKQRREHALVVDDVRARYRAAGADPVLVAPRELLRFPTVQHLATTITAHFRQRAPTVVELCAALHPTAAVAAVPWPGASALIDEHEQLERGWYAGAVGWTDGRGDGTFALTLRCGLLWEDGVRLYAGAGVMPDSSPLEELQETDVKFLALLDALRGSLTPPPPTPLGVTSRSRRA